VERLPLGTGQPLSVTPGKAAVVGKFRRDVTRLTTRAGQLLIQSFFGGEEEEGRPNMSPGPRIWAACRSMAIRSRPLQAQPRVFARITPPAPRFFSDDATNQPSSKASPSTNTEVPESSTAGDGAAAQVVGGLTLGLLLGFSLTRWWC
jgi:hypothetical protein